MLPATRFVFFGTPEFAAIILNKLIKAGFIPQAVVCNPDRPIGRKQIITPPPVKTSILQQVASIQGKIKIFQPDIAKDLLDTKYQLQATNPDFFIVAAYAKILPKEILDIPRLGTIGVHPSILPKYRGASPIQSAILGGEKKTGITLFLLDEKLDHGPILTESEIEISKSDTFQSLRTKLADSGGDLLIETLPKFIKGEITPLPQDEAKATYTKKFKTEDAYIEPHDLEKAQNEGEKIAIEIEKKIRALNPEPGIWTLRDGKRIKLLEAEIIDGKLKITKLQVEGKKPQNI